jgi:hypothetical protein
MKGVTFVTDAQTGYDISARFNNAGIRAEFVSHKTPGPKRYAIMEAYEAGDILQLVNIDLFSEGYDCPAMQTCSCARPSKSTNVITQQFGRPLRPLWPDDCRPFDMDTPMGRKAAIASSGKPYAKIFDHAGNFLDSAHGLPDARNVWTLDRRDRRQKADPDAIPVRVCGNPACLAVFERIERACPYCGWIPQIAGNGRGGPEEIDGRLCDLDPNARARLEEMAKKAVMDPASYRYELRAKHCPEIAIERNVRRHRERVAYQQALRPVMDMYITQRRMQGMQDSEIQQRFYYRFGIDMLSARSLPLKETKSLVERIVMEGV